MLDNVPCIVEGRSIDDGWAEGFAVHAFVNRQGVIDAYVTAALANLNIEQRGIQVMSVDIAISMFVEQNGDSEKLGDVRLQYMPVGNDDGQSNGGKLLVPVWGFYDQALLPLVYYDAVPGESVE